MGKSAPSRGTRDWLLALCRHNQPEAVNLPVPTEDNLEELVAALVLHGTAAIALGRINLFPVLSPIEGRLRAIQAHNVARTFVSITHLASISSALGTASVPWIAIKGIPLALRRYGDLAARRVGDIDILVSPAHLAAADKALRDIGWHPADLGKQAAPLLFWHERRYTEPGGMILELHHRLHPNPHLLGLPAATLLDHCHELDIGGTRIPVLDPVTELLYLSTHGSRSSWYRLLMVCDIAAIVAQEPPEFLDAAHREAKRLGVLQPLAQALLLAETLLGASAPAWAQRVRQTSARQRRSLAFAEETLWCAREANDYPLQRSRSSLLNALDQRLDLRFWLWELVLRAGHEWHQWRASR